MRFLKKNSYRRLLATTLALSGCVAEEPEEEVLSDQQALASITPESVTTGTSSDLDAYGGPDSFAIPAGTAMVPIVGVAIAGDEHVYTWFADNTVSQGYSKNLAYYSGPLSVTLPAGRSASTIVGVGIAANDHVWTWFSDNKVCQGTTRNLCGYSGPTPFTLPPGESIDKLIGVDIASGDHVYSWYSDGKKAIGTPTALLAPGQSLQPYTHAANQKSSHVVDMGISANDTIYTWYQDMEHGMAWSALANVIDPLVVDKLHTNKIAGMTVAISKNGKMVLNRGYGYKDITTQAARMDTDRSPIGSVSKWLTALGVVRYAQEAPLSFSLDKPVYTATGVLTSPAYGGHLQLGEKRHQPLVGFAIGAGDRVYAWYQDGTYTTGTTMDVDSLSAPAAYTLAVGKTPDDVLAIAIAGDGRTYTWYTDGNRSVGTPANLALHGTTAFSVPNGESASSIVAIGIRKSDDRVFAWYDDAKVSSGTSTDLDAASALATVTLPNHTPWDIVGADFAASGRVYFHYHNDQGSAGTPTQPEADLAPYASPVPQRKTNNWLDWYRQITPRHLLSHTSGITGGGSIGDAARYFGIPPNSVTYEQINQHVLGTRTLLGAPGTRSEYSNHGAGLAGFVVEKASGVPYQTYMRQHILDPLGLINIVPRDTAGDGRDSSVHTALDSGPLGKIQNGPIDLRGLASGGWAATAGDLVRLMLATDQKPNHPDILTSSALQTMETRAFPSGVFGLGWEVDSDNRVAKSGQIDGASALIAKYPAGYKIDNVDVGGITVALCANSVRSVTAQNGDATSVTDNDLRSLLTAVARAAGTVNITDANYDLY